MTLKFWSSCLLFQRAETACVHIHVSSVWAWVKPTASCVLDKPSTNQAHPGLRRAIYLRCNFGLVYNLNTTKTAYIKVFPAANKLLLISFCFPLFFSIAVTPSPCCPLSKRSSLLQWIFASTWKALPLLFMWLLPQLLHALFPITFLVRYYTLMTFLVTLMPSCRTNSSPITYVFSQSWNVIFLSWPLKR